MRIENLIGKKNYEKQLEKDSFQYRQPISRNTQSLKFRNLLQETTGKVYILYGLFLLVMNKKSSTILVSFSLTNFLRLSL